MTAYNAGKTIAETIASVLGQTFSAFEFIIVNDGSTDNTKEVISSFSDKRIKLIDNPVNLGIIDSANKGLGYCRSKYVARIDADDICHPKRFLRQYRFMERNPNCVVCGTHYRKIRNSKIVKPSSKHFFHVRDKILRIEMLRNSPIGNPTVIYRRSLVEEHGLRYDHNYLYCEDYAFLCQALNFGEIHILNRPLVYYRQHSEQISTKYAGLQCENANKIRVSLIKRLVPDISSLEVSTHLALMTDLNSRKDITNEQIRQWVDRVCGLNKEKKIYDVALFDKFMHRRGQRIIENK